MKKILTLSFTMAAIAAIILIISCSKDNTLMTDAKLSNNPDSLTEDQPLSDSNGEELPDCEFLNVSSIELTDIEVEMLKYVREEEKMAHDVYYVLAEIYKPPIFRNIVKSEQDHMDKVLCLLIHFNIEDPASDEIGIFENHQIQELYDFLIDLGSNNIIDGLTAGAIIEDYDIKNLNDWMVQTDNESIVRVLTNIVCGSGNHMISFTELLKKHDTVYDPIYITPAEYLAILTAGHQFCGF